MGGWEGRGVHDWVHDLSVNLLFLRADHVPTRVGGVFQHFAADGEFLGGGDWGQGVPRAHSLDVSDCVCVHYWRVGGVLCGEERVGGGAEAVVGEGAGEGGGWVGDGEEEG